MPWSDDNPFYLIIVPDVGEVAEIDLGQFHWMKAYADLLRAPGEWHLVRKLDRAVMFSLHVLEGEQPYYVCRHVAATGAVGSNEVLAYGIGKKRKVRGRWQTDRLWVLENGQVCGGDDVEPFAKALLMKKGPRTT